VTAAESYARIVGLTIETEEPSVKPIVDPADMRAHTLLEMTRDEVAILKLFNSPAAPIRDQAIALEIYAWQATTLKPSESPAR
jgi:hypothetical protein